MRTGDFAAPFPEEFHRRAIAVSTALHCAPTETAAANLRRENIPDDRILVSGNTVIDALLETAAQAPAPPAGFPGEPRTILLTAHRRESFGEPLREALTAIRTFVNMTPDTAVFFPVHPNPAARSVANEVLADHARIVLTEPISYPEMVGAMQRAWADRHRQRRLAGGGAGAGQAGAGAARRDRAAGGGRRRRRARGRHRAQPRVQALIDLYCDCPCLRAHGEAGVSLRRRPRRAAHRRGLCALRLDPANAAPLRAAG